MKRNNKILGLFFMSLVISAVLFSCKKPTTKFPQTNEAIAFDGIDSTTIEMKAGEDLNLDVILVTDTIIDSLHIGYLIDTIAITHNLTYSDIETVLVSTGFTEKDNRHIYAASLKLPPNAYGIRPFRHYTNGIGDYVRIIFKMTAGTKSYEKQIKVIIEP